MLARKGEPRPGPFTFEEYLVWEADQDEKWELVDSYAVRRSERWHYDPITGMAGATSAHNRVVANLITSLNVRLRGGPCWAAPSDLKTRARRGNARYPDVTVECGRPGPSSLIAGEPRVVFEVLSKSNTLPKQLRLLDDYQSVEAMRQIVWFEQSRPFGLSWTRADPVWPREELDSLDATLVLPSLSIELPLKEIYEGVEFGSE